MRFPLYRRPSGVPDFVFPFYSLCQWINTPINGLKMDDTVILATTRERVIEQIVILKDFCESAGMVINESKTKFMAINGNAADREVILVGGNEVLAIQHCDRPTYNYLGRPIVSLHDCDGRARTAVKEHAKCAKKYLMKLIAFFKRRPNTDMPFIVKK